MNKKPLILGIESSCDETAASIISENDQGNPIVLSNIISSQVDVHKEFGGVVPELAARSHIEKIDWIVQKAIDESQKNVNGYVRAKLYKGNVIITGRKSPNSLYDEDLVTFEEGSFNYNHHDAEGFIKLNALRLMMNNIKQK